MGSLSRLGALLSSLLTDWRGLTLGDLRYARLDFARLGVVGLVGLTLAVLIARAGFSRASGRRQLGLPAILPTVRHSWLAILRHAPVLFFVAGLPFFLIALAEPYTALSKTEVSYPGRRIGIIIDASASMNGKFYADKLKYDPQNENAFFTTVAAAELFINDRMKGRYRDLISLVEFGDEAYVVTPFTNDYDNILLSLSLIGDPTEFKSFPDKGTTIGAAIEECVNLFRSFAFLNAAGNVMVVFSDGQDDQATVHGREAVGQVVDEAVKAKVPVYFIRTNYDKGLGELVPDKLWSEAVERTGGRFYAASDEATILRAVHEIDLLSTGRIDLRQYSTEVPQFAPFAAMAALCWAMGLALKLSLPFFTKFP